MGGKPRFGSFLVIEPVLNDSLPDRHRTASPSAHFKPTMAITDTAVHDIDIARFLLNDEPVAIAVRAPRGNRRAGGVADPLLALIDMRSARW